MNKNVRSVKNSLKFKAEPRAGIVSVRTGGRKFTLPIEARVLKGEDFVFLSLPASSEIYEVKEGELNPLPPEANAEAAFEALNPAKRAGAKSRSKSSLPPQLAEALKSVPPGFKVGYDANGQPRLVRKRRRG